MENLTITEIENNNNNSIIYFTFSKKVGKELRDFESSMTINLPDVTEAEAPAMIKAKFGEEV